MLPLDNENGGLPADLTGQPSSHFHLKLPASYYLPVYLQGA